MGRFFMSLALLGLLAGATPTFARGGPLHLFESQREQPVSRAGVPTPSLSPSELLGGCGRGRYRDPGTHICRGPADVGR